MVKILSNFLWVDLHCVYYIVENGNQINDFVF